MFHDLQVLPSYHLRAPTRKAGGRIHVMDDGINKMHRGLMKSRPPPPFYKRLLSFRLALPQARAVATATRCREHAAWMQPIVEPPPSSPQYAFKDSLTLFFLQLRNLWPTIPIAALDPLFQRKSHEKEDMDEKQRIYIVPSLYPLLPLVCGICLIIGRKSIKVTSDKSILLFCVQVLQETLLKCKLCQIASENCAKWIVVEKNYFWKFQ